MWAFDLTGKFRKIGKRRIKIEKQLTEITDELFAQRHVLALARYLDQEQEEILLKIRYDLNPEPFDIDDIETTRKLAEDRFLWEVDTVEALQEIGRGPKYLAHGRQTAREMFPYPEGKVSFIMMSRVKGENVADICDSLSLNDLETIRVQLAEIMEYLRQEGKILYSQNPNNLRYDREQKKLYFIDFTFIQFIKTAVDMPKPITPDNAFVLSYGLWSKAHLERARRATRGDDPA